MYHEKRYLQFNNLVFDGYDMISASDESISTKITSQAYSYTHGSYVPFKRDYMLVSEGSVTMTLILYTRKLPCEDREFYIRLAEQELMRPGKLWAIKNGEILWTNAYVKTLHMIRGNRMDSVEYDLEFGLPDGIWHKADKQRTFVLPYDVCTFMDCKGYRTVNPCVSTDGCCEACKDNKWYEDMADRCFCCCVDEITAGMALCNHMKELQNFYGCATPFQLVYDCERAERFNHADYIGQRLCVEDVCESSQITGRFYSETDIPTENVRIVLTGRMHDPWITINGNTNIIEGDYDGDLIIEPSGDVYYKQGECCDAELLDPSVWTIPKGMTYGWTVYPQNNSIVIDLGECCTGGTCVYIDADNITT